VTVSLDLRAPVDAADHRRGVNGGPQLVVYGDFECPYTAAAMREIDHLLGRGVTFEVLFRYFPLREIHPHAQAAAEAAEAAARQDRFWEMHDLLFRNQMRLDADDLRRFADRLELDLMLFESDVVGPAVKARIERDIETGIESGVDGTPSLFIGGRRYLGPRDAEDLGMALDEAR
jgi:Na+:H+ antiporter, NhaA family